MEGTDVVALTATLLGGTAIAPAVDALKDARLPARFAKLAAIAIGAAFGALAGLIVGDETVFAALVVTGLVSGLMASRNYDSAKTEGVQRGLDIAEASGTPGTRKKA